MRLTSKKTIRALNTLVLLLLVTIVPLYLHNRYFDLVRTKAKTLRICLIIVLISVFLISLLKRKDDNKRINGIIVSLIVFSIIGLISSYYSQNFLDSFWGNKGWGIGSFAILAATLIIIYYSSNNIDEESFFIILSITNIFIFSLGILHSMKIDVLHLHDGIYHEQYFSYISTIGNVNWMVGYLCLLLPIFYKKASNENNSKLRALYSIVTCLAVSNILLCNSDAIYLGICFYLIASCPKEILYSNNFQKLALLLIPFGVTCLSIKYLPMFQDKCASLESITAFIVNNKYLAVLFIIVGIVCVLLGKKINFKPLYRNIILIIVEMALISSLIYLIVDLLNAYNNFNFYWGNNRLRLWKETNEIFNRYLPFEQKLIGVGPEMQGLYYYAINEELGATFLSTHSEPIQLAFTYGWLGLLTYFSIIIQFIIHYFKNLKNNEFLLYFCPLFAYFGQSLVNSGNPTNFIIMCVVVSLCLNKLQPKMIVKK